jgi:hypothetical protein
MKRPKYKALNTSGKHIVRISCGSNGIFDTPYENYGRAVDAFKDHVKLEAITCAGARSTKVVRTVALINPDGSVDRRVTLSNTKTI